ncbi:beta-propeller domain-containing protein [Bacillus sp. SCS-151]|uniref:beta-propeller domain-containing protein n=1 Tax=Nanhaiella sioensis TaxID=3115293 RepID=UPI00397E4BC1
MKKFSVISFCIVALSFLFGLFFYQFRPAIASDLIDLNEQSVVLPNKMWEISFSSPVDESTISSQSVYIKNSQNKKADVSLLLSEDNKLLTITAPADGYEVKEDYTLVITSEVALESGKRLPSNTTFSFTVIPEIPTIGSKEELHEYFQDIIDFYETNRDMTVMEEKADAEVSTLSEGNSYSETNNQVQGVDEADRVKTDGEFIYHISNQDVIITKAVPADDMEVVATISNEDFSPSQLFIEGDKLIVIGSTYGTHYYEAAKRSLIAPIEQVTNAYVYDITKRDNPIEVRAVSLEGSYVTARKVDSIIYLVANQYPHYWIMKDEEPIDLRPSYYDSAVSDDLQMVNYDEISYIPDSKEANYMMIGTFDVKKPDEEMKVTTWLGSGHNIYMSKDNLYVAVTKFPMITNFERLMEETFTQSTEIYKFSIDGSDVKFYSYGEVPGTVLNQFSMDEAEGYFRIATTSGQVWSDERPSSNNLYVLDDKMTTVGSLEDLAMGERIYSVRFMNDRAYVVTFKQVDPLFVLDLSNPNKPAVLGELKIPGFSNYLHPYDENHIIGFGQNTTLIANKDPNLEPRVITDGVKISLFDITDVTNPQEKFTEIIGGRGTYSPLNYDHKALLFNKDMNLFAFPIAVYDNKVDSEFEQIFSFQGGYIYHLDLENGFQLNSTVTHQQDNILYPDWENEIYRLIYIDNVLYALSPSTITAHNLSTHEEINKVLVK